SNPSIHQSITCSPTAPPLHHSNSPFSVESLLPASPCPTPSNSASSTSSIAPKTRTSPPNNSLPIANLVPVPKKSINNPTCAILSALLRPPLWTGPPSSVVVTITRSNAFTWKPTRSSASSASAALVTNPTASPKSTP